MSTWREITAFLLLATTSGAGNAAVTTTLVDVPTRGVVQRILYIKPDAPIANVIALPGADTVLDILDDGSLPTQVGNCFPPARLRDAFTGRGLAIALVDTPSDYRGRDLEQYRIGAEQIADVLEVIRHVQQRADVPTWIVGGTSATSSIVNLAASLPSDVPLGAILFSINPVSAQLEPGAVRRPTLVVANSTSFEVQRSQALLDKMGLAPVKELAILTGAREKDCPSRLFEGVESDFVDTVAGFIDRYNGLLQPVSKALNVQGMFYNAPAESEAGWGINFAHQGDVIFATWFTYDETGRAWWLTMTAEKTGPNTYAGKLYETRGPAFNAVPFTPSAVHAIEVGDGTLTFTDANNGSFRYMVNGITQTKTLVRQVFGAVPGCTWGGQSNLALATNFQDLWWAAPAGVESGWGVNFTHQGDTIFTTWFTYDFDGKPLWLSATVRKTASGVYTGAAYRTTGPAFSTLPWDKSTVTVTQVGDLTITFANGNTASFHYTLMLGTPPVAIAQTKQVTRQVFRVPGTVCK